MPLVQQVSEKSKYDSVSFVTVNLGGSAAGIAQFMADNKYTFISLVDPQGASGRDYGAQYVPTTFFIDKDGYIQDKVIGGFENTGQIEERIDKLLK